MSAYRPENEPICYKPERCSASPVFPVFAFSLPVSLAALFPVAMPLSSEAACSV